MPKTCVHGTKRPQKRGDQLVGQVLRKFGCRLYRLFVVAFAGKSRESMKAAYRLYQKRGTLAEDFRKFVYDAVHELLPEAVLDRLRPRRRVGA